ncbi:MAG: cytochrome c5 family protein [Steroidobacteraceae bacterium]|nr:cytochrome c5 family protein [Steroidobacteraceae bacterium]
MAKPDRHFMNVFSAVLGILIAISLVLIGISRFADSGPKGARDTSDPLMQAQAHERIKPFGQVAVAGEDNAGLAIEAPARAVPAGGPGAPAASAAAKPMDPKMIYDTACMACHGMGIAGAPKTGDRGAWNPRIAAGTATLYKHAIEGFQGSVGFMPAKGGRADLSDDAVKAAVDYMIAQVK